MTTAIPQTPFALLSGSAMFPDAVAELVRLRKEEYARLSATKPPDAFELAEGAYLPLSTTLPIWIGGVIKGVVDRRSGVRTETHGEEIGPGSLFATGLVAGGTLTGTIVAFLHWPDEPGKASWLDPVDFGGRLSRALGAGGYQLLGIALFAVMGISLYRVARRRFSM